MAQRYRVFLNDKVIRISEIINTEELEKDAFLIQFETPEGLQEVYERFRSDIHCSKLLINAGNKFAEACRAFNAIFTPVQAAGGLVFNQTGNLLVIFRLGKWDLPKGKLEAGESASAGAQREVMEETGLSSLRIVRELPSTYHIYTDRKGADILKETRWFEMENTGPEELRPQLEEDILEARWISRDEISGICTNTYASLRELFSLYDPETKK
jgi:8-oxo-dGTP pyrophosphatase MutT (NUDIX family)